MHITAVNIGTATESTAVSSALDSSNSRFLIAEAPDHSLWLRRKLQLGLDMSCTYTVNIKHLKFSSNNLFFEHSTVGHRLLDSIDSTN